MANSTQDGDRELDLYAATIVMGWKAWYVDIRYGIFGARLPEGDIDQLDYYETPSERRPCGWSPTSDVRDDYEVLRRVRETWPVHGIQAFGILLYDLWQQRLQARSVEKDLRHVFGAVVYMPGDYAKSAAAVLQGQEQG